MFSMLPKPQVFLRLMTVRGFATTNQAQQAKGAKVAVLGASGGIGQPLCLLLKQMPLISQLSLYDVLHSPGVAADLSHINTSCDVRGFGPGELGSALSGADFVLVAAGVPRKAGQSMQDQFIATSRIMKDLAVSCARENPNAIYGIISHPIISSVPVFSEMFNKAGVYNPKKILGITKLGEIRASTFLAQELKQNPNQVYCPVIGGHAGVTILPVLSQSKPAGNLSADQAKRLTQRLRDASTEVFEAKFGSGAVTLSMAYAGAKFTDSLVRAILGEKDVVESCYVRSDVTQAKYFSNRVVLGPNGVEKNLGLGKLSDYEQEQVTLGLPELKRSIEAGEAFAAQKV